MNVGFEVMRAEIPAGHDYVLSMMPASTWPLLLQIRGNTIAVRPTESLIKERDTELSNCDQPSDAPLTTRRERSECRRGSSEQSREETKIDRIALSPTGSAAAFFSESQGRIYAFTNLAQSPSLLGQLEVGRLGRLSSFGISDDGRTVVVGVSDGEKGSVFLLNLDRDRSPRLIASMPHPSVVQFLHRSDRAIIADAAEDKVYALAGGQIFTIATAEQGIADPVGVRVSNDNQRVFVGNSQTGSVTTVSLSGTAAEPKYCNCILTGLHPTNADSVFRLTDFSGGPVLLFDGSAADPRMVFVPAGSQ